MLPYLARHNIDTRNQPDEHRTCNICNLLEIVHVHIHNYGAIQHQGTSQFRRRDRLIYDSKELVF